MRRPAAVRIPGPAAAGATLLLVWGAFAPGPLQGQQGTGADALVLTSIRPARVRVGAPARVTVTVRSHLGPPQSIDLDVPPGVEILTYQDGYSTGVGSAETVVERQFEVVAREPGTHGLLPVVVDFDGADAPADSVLLEAEAPALAWATPEPRARWDAPRDEVLPEGVPPASSPDTREVLPGGTTIPVYPGPPLRYPGAPGQAGPAIGGYGPGGWAETAPSDPWWPEILPELNTFQTVTEDWTGTVRLSTGVTPPVVFPGQQITHVATASYLEDFDRVLQGGHYQPPRAPGIDAVDLPEVTGAPAAFRGEVAVSHTYRTAFFADGPGPVELGPSVLRYSMGRATLGRPPLDSVASGPLVVDVRPIPVDDAPPDWTGAVGRLRIEAFVSPATVVEGQPAVLVVRVLGVGRLRDRPPPPLDPIFGAEAALLGETGFLEVRDGVVGGVKTFTFQVTPWESGVVRIGPVVYAFFDPYVGGFGRVASQEVLLEVLPYQR